MDASKNLLTHGNSDDEKISPQEKICDQSRAHPAPEVPLPDRPASVIKLSMAGFAAFLTSTM